MKSKTKIEILVLINSEVDCQVHDFAALTPNHKFNSPTEQAV
jgi:hypothetical protein